MKLKPYRHSILAPAALLAGLLAGTGPAGAVFIQNAVSINALTNNALAGNALTNNALNTNALVSNGLHLNGTAATGGALANLNGVAIEAIVLPKQTSR
jgi:hypothetical protein